MYICLREETRQGHCLWTNFLRRSVKVACVYKEKVRVGTRKRDGSRLAELTVV